MSKYDNKKLITQLQEKWGSRSCPMCGKGPWNVQDSTYQLLEFSQGGGLVIGGPVLPVIPIVCGNCGNTILVNPIVAGVLEPQVPAKEEPKNG